MDVKSQRYLVQTRVRNRRKKIAQNVYSALCCMMVIESLRIKWAGACSTRGEDEKFIQSFSRRS